MDVTGVGSHSKAGTEYERKFPVHLMFTHLCNQVDFLCLIPADDGERFSDEVSWPSELVWRTALEQGCYNLTGLYAA